MSLHQPGVLPRLWSRLLRTHPPSPSKGMLSIMKWSGVVALPSWGSSVQTETWARAVRANRTTAGGRAGGGETV